MTSVDEAMIDVTLRVAQEEEEESCKDRSDPAKRLAEKIRADIRNETSCEGMILGFDFCLSLTRPNFQ